MIHDGNKIWGHDRSAESIELIKNHLTKLHVDGDQNSLYCRFNELLNRMRDQEVSAKVTWGQYMRVLYKPEKTED